MRLIDADALKKIFDADKEGKKISYNIFVVNDKIDSVPTIEERKTGRWEFVSYGDGLGNYHCSECRAIASSYFVGNLVNRHWEYKLTKYCPKCGAKMEGSDSDAVD